MRRHQNKHYPGLRKPFFGICANQFVQCEASHRHSNMFAQLHENVVKMELAQAGCANTKLTSYMLKLCFANLKAASTILAPLTVVLFSVIMFYISTQTSPH